MRKIHYLSDFTLTLTGVSFPDYDFEVYLYTDGATKFTATYAGGVKTCVSDNDGTIEVNADGHGLNPGRVRGRLTRHIPDADYPDGVQTIVDEFATDVVLTSGFAEKKDGEESDGEESDGEGWAGGATIFGHYKSLAGVDSSVVVTGSYTMPGSTSVLVTEGGDVVVTETSGAALIMNKEE